MPDWEEVGRIAMLGWRTLGGRSEQQSIVVRNAQRLATFAALRLRATHSGVGEPILRLVFACVCRSILYCNVGKSLHAF